jgi:hypothetical protein
VKKIVPEKVSEDELIAQKRTKAIADKENNSSLANNDETLASVEVEDRKIIKAQRRSSNEEAGKENSESKAEPEESKKKESVFNSQFTPAKFNFSAGFKIVTSEEAKASSDGNGGTPFDFKCSSKFKGFSAPTMKTEKPEEEKKSFVQVNPLDSVKSLESKTRSKKRDQGKESPVLKSLFDVKENQQFKHPGSSKKTSSKKASKKSGPFSEPVNPFATYTSAIIFKPNAGSGQKFAGQGANPFGKAPEWLTKKAEESPKKEDAPTDQNKKFQSQIDKLKILVGVGEANPEPCTKDDGYLSIEESGANKVLVLRTSTGAIVFQADIDKASKVVSVEDETVEKWKSKDNQICKKTLYKVKFTVSVKTKE